MAIKKFKNISLAPYTTFQIGGRAKYFFIVKTIEQLMEAVLWSKQNKIKYFILGGGSNLLISDRGFSGLVIKLDIQSYKLRESRLIAGAGLSLSRLVQLAAKNNLSGLEWGVGIPGTVGGAIRGNAGAFGQAIGQTVDKVIVLTSPVTIERWSAVKCRFAYRNSIFKSNRKVIILGVELKLRRGRGAFVGQQMKEFLRRRCYQPRQYSAGCVFKNPTLTLCQRFSLITRYPDAANKISQNGLIPAAWLIDQCGLRGKKSGQAQISLEHANFIINLGQAKARDVRKLIALIKKTVYNKLNIKLQEEVEIV